MCRLACLATSADKNGKGGEVVVQNRGAEEFYAWMPVNSNYGAGHVTGQACNFCLCVMREAKCVVHVLISLVEPLFSLADFQGN